MVLGFGGWPAARVLFVVQLIQSKIFPVTATLIK